MTGHLFQSSWHHFWALALRQAADNVERLDLKVLLGSDLSSQLERIAESYSLEIAQLDETRIMASRRETERIRPDVRNDECLFKQGWLDVTIPFSGEAETLRIAPTVCVIPSVCAEIGTHTLTLTVRDDNHADGEIDECIRQIAQNLENLRKDYREGKSQLEQTIKQVAENRQKRIREEEWNRLANRLRRLT